MASYFDFCWTTAVAVQVLAPLDNFVNMTSSTSIIKISLTPQQIVKKRQSSSEKKKKRILQHVYSWFLIWWQIDFFPKLVCHPAFLSCGNKLCAQGTRLQMELNSQLYFQEQGPVWNSRCLPNWGVSRRRRGESRPMFRQWKSPVHVCGCFHSTIFLQLLTLQLILEGITVFLTDPNYLN